MEVDGMTRIYLDAMGGDNAPQCTVEGALEALRADKELQITLAGPREQIEALLTDAEDVRSRLTVEDAPEIITNHDAPVMAVRQKKNSAVVQSLNHAEVCVVKLNILAHQSYSDALRKITLFLNHICPLRKVGRSFFKPKLTAGNFCKSLLLQHKGYGIKAFRIHILYNSVGGHITEHSHLFFHIRRNWMFGSANYNIGLDTYGKQLFNGMLCGLCLHLSAFGKVGNQSYVYIKAVFLALFP